MGYGRIFRRQIQDDEIERIYAYYVGDTVKWSTNDKHENEWEDSRLDFTNMLAKGGWEEDGNTPAVMIDNRLEGKIGGKTLQIEFEKAVGNAESEIQNDEQSLHLVRRIIGEQLDIQRIKQRKKTLNKLINLGIVTVFLDNTLVLAPIGEQVLKNLQKPPNPHSFS